MDLGFPIALNDDIAELISNISIELQRGDGIVLYTDGIPEAQNINKKQYGLEEVCDIISKNWHLSAEEIKQAVIDDLRRHIGTQKLFDGITLLVLKQQVETKVE
jgi:serine phosphatase RsbU (regulator of sigma subunit)